MRYVYLSLIILITLVVVAFSVQNLGTVTVGFLSSSLTLPLSILVFLVYVLGMLTGGSLVSLIRSLIKGATVEPAPGHKNLLTK